MPTAFGSDWTLAFAGCGGCAHGISNVSAAAGRRFSTEDSVLGLDEKHVAQMLHVPADDDGAVDLFAKFSEVVHFIGKPSGSANGREVVPRVFRYP